MNAGPGPSIGELIYELIAVLADACESADRSRKSRPRRNAAMNQRVRAAEQARPVAALLARSVAAGDYAGADRILSLRRNLPEWRRLTLMLASAADPARLAPAPAPIAGRARIGGGS